jgi:lycopene cyclase domain-containing protein
VISSQLEYLFVLGVFSVVTHTLAWSELQDLLVTKAFWLSLSIYFVICSVVDWYAIKNGWWTFSSFRLCGASLFTIPVEEYILFAIVFTGTIVAWELLGDELA